MAKKRAATRRSTAPRSLSGRKPTAARADKRESERSRGGRSRATRASRAAVATRTPESDSPAQPATSVLDQTAAAIGRALGHTTSALSNVLPWSGKDDGLEMLERDHRQLESLLDQGARTSEQDVEQRRTLLRDIVQALAVHELIEEKVLYPALKTHAEAKDIVLEGYQEHHVADLVVAELREMPPSDERWGAKMKVLKENVEHHIEEEEGEMFKTARSIFSVDQLQALGARMQALKQDSGVPPRVRRRSS